MLDPAARRARNAKKNLNNISEIRRFFHRNEHPIYFISPTNFNLLGIDEWVKNFKYVTYIDCYEGRHPNVFCPSEQPHDEFTSIEEINNYLLQHKEVIDRVERRGGKPKLVFLMFEENTEKLAKELGWQVWFPRAKLHLRCSRRPTGTLTFATATAEGRAPAMMLRNSGPCSSKSWPKLSSGIQAT